MTPPAPDAPRQPPRFVPTLTEVVMPDLADEAPVPLDPTPVDPLVDVLAQRVLQALGPTLDRLVAERVASVVHAQLEGLGQRVHQAVESVVREAVAEALVQVHASTEAPR